MKNGRGRKHNHNGIGTAAGLLSVLMLLLPILILTGCGASSDAEALAALPDLVARAEVLNEYIWGQGAPVEQSDDGGSTSSAQYERVTSDAPFTTLTGLTEEILQVYSTEYCKIIMEIVLEGSDDAFARYYEDAADGRLTRDVTNTGFTLRTRLDPSQARVKSSGFNRVKIAMPCTFDGQPDGDYIVTLVFENGAWRLDSPTY